MRRKITNKRGVSVVELLVGLGVATIVFLGAQELLLEFTKSQKRADVIVENATEEFLIVRTVSRDILNGDLSFGSLDISDDGGNNFFDYINDSPCTNGVCERKFTLDGVTNSQFLMITNVNVEYDDSSFMVQTFMPATFYQFSSITNSRPSVSGSGASFSVTSPTTMAAPPMTYEGLSKGLQKAGSSFEGMNELFMFYAPIFEREMNIVTGRVESTSIPQRHFVLAYPSPDSEYALSHSILSSAGYSGASSVRSTHAVQRTYEVSSADKFFRTISPIGGSGTIVMARPVNVILYEVERSDDGKTARLYRAIYNHESKAFDSKALIGTGFDKLIFERKDLSGKNIDLKVVRAPSA